METLEYTMWALLLTQSVVTGACVLKCIHDRAERNSDAPERTTKACAQIIWSLAGQHNQRCADLSRLTRTTTHDPAEEIFQLCLKRPVHYEELSERIHTAVARHCDRGGVRLHRFMIKTAPMVGIGGTVIGLLIAFYSITTVDLSAGLNGIRLWLETAVGGMAAALISTLWGIGISIFAKASLDGIHIPNLESEFDRVLQRAEQLGDALTRHRLAGWGANPQHKKKRKAKKHPKSQASSTPMNSPVPVRTQERIPACPDLM